MQIFNYAGSWIEKSATHAFERLLKRMAEAENARREEDISNYRLDEPHLSKSDAMPWEQDENDDFY